MKKIILAAAATSLFATSFSPYFGYIKYDNSAKDFANFGGVYFSKFSSPYKVELSGSYLYQKNSDGTNYKQTDLTAVLTYYKGYNWLFRGAVHNIFYTGDKVLTSTEATNLTSTRNVPTKVTTTQTQSTTEYDNLFYLGALYYKYLKYNVGVDVYYGNYSSVKTTQVTLRAGKNFGNYYSKVGSFYAQAKLNYIMLSNKETTPKDNYTNVDFKLENFKGAYTTTLKASVGDIAYKASEEGMVVYNSADVYKYSFGLKLSKAVTKTETLAISYDYAKFSENGTATSNTIMLSYFKVFK
jgi:uncharacterized protein YjbI with pentapeptide repeats